MAASKLKDFFQEKGYVVIRGAIEHEAIDAFWSEFELLRETDPLLQFAEYGEIRCGRDLAHAQKLRMRAINLQNRSPRARAMAMHKPIMTALNAIYGYRPACIQTLAYSQSSRQGAHSDMYLVSPPYIGEYDRGTLCASWIACEDANEDNGALIVYPGSHRIEKPTLGDCANDYPKYVAALEAACTAHSIEPTVFRARKGDVLLWHGDFVHAGGRPVDDQRTRASYVCHYAQVPGPAIKPGRATFVTHDERYVFGDEAA